MIGVDLFGQPADWPALTAIARAEDCSCWMTWRKASARRCTASMLGSQADATATSFFPSKPLGAYGDGGALFTESEDRAELYRSLRTHGEGKTRYEVLRTGMNGRLDSMQAAVLLSKLTVFPEELRGARKDRPVLRPAAGQRRHDAGTGCRQHQRLGDLRHPAARWAARDRVQAALRADGVPTAIYYPRPLHRQPAYRAPRRRRDAGVRRPGDPHPRAADPSRPDRPGC